MSARSEKRPHAEEVVNLWISFQTALSNKRKYPTQEFTTFAKSVREYLRVVGSDPLIHREVASAINGLVDFLQVERRRVPDVVIYEAKPIGKSSLLWVRSALRGRRAARSVARNRVHGSDSVSESTLRTA